MNTSGRIEGKIQFPCKESTTGFGLEEEQGTVIHKEVQRNPKESKQQFLSWILNRIYVHIYLQSFHIEWMLSEKGLRSQKTTLVYAKKNEEKDIRQSSPCIIIRTGSDNFLSM